MGMGGGNRMLSYFLIITSSIIAVITFIIAEEYSQEEVSISIPQNINDLCSKPKRSYEDLIEDSYRYNNDVEVQSKLLQSCAICPSYPHYHTSIEFDNRAARYTLFRLENAAETEIDIYWLNHNGKEEHKGSHSAGEAGHIKAKTGDVFRIRRSSDDLLLMEHMVGRIGLRKNKDGPIRRALSAIGITTPVSDNDFVAEPIINEKIETARVEREIPPAADSSVGAYFINGFGYPVQIYWLNEYGKEEFTASLNALEELGETTYLNHNWIVRSLTGELLLEYQIQNLMIRDCPLKNKIAKNVCDNEKECIAGTNSITDKRIPLQAQRIKDKENLDITESAGEMATKGYNALKNKSLNGLPDDVHYTSISIMKGVQQNDSTSDALPAIDK